jgi:Uma2 family endonuclease
MSDPYEEIVEGETFLRLPPGHRHELICERLHARINTCLTANPALRLLESRSVVQISAGTIIRPDVTLIDATSGKIWLAIEVVNSEDHHTDTVTKKSVYEDVNLNRLWMVDPRYENVEIYHGSTYGLTLRKILAGREMLDDDGLPGFQVTIAELFQER